MPGQIMIKHIGTTQVVTINRPNARNSVNPDTANELRAAFEAGEKNDAVKVHVLTGADGIFCAGADLKAVAAGRKFNTTAPMGPTWLKLSKPSIAAIEGHAVAGGLELAVFCDLRVVAESAIMGVFCRRWGVPLVDGGTVRLPRLIGHSRAMDMILTGRAVSAEEALSFGLANRMVPDGTALREAIEIAETIAKFPQECMRNDRESALEQWDLSFEDALAVEAAIGRKSFRNGATAGAKRFEQGKGRGGSFNNI